MQKQLSIFINAVEGWGSSYVFVFTLLLAVVFFCIIYLSFVSIRRIERKLHANSSYTEEKIANISSDISTLDTGMAQIAKDVKITSNQKEIEKLATTAAELTKDIKNSINDQHAYLYDKFSELGDKYNDIGNKDDHLLTEVLQKLDQLEMGTTDSLEEKLSTRISVLEHKLEEIMEKRLSGAIEFMDGLGEKISSLTSTQEKIDKINKNVTQLSQLMSMSGANSVGAMVHKRLGDLLAQSLPEGSYKLNTPLPNDAVASALLCLPEPNSAVVIDAELSLESFFQSVDVNNLDEKARAQARENFHREAVERINFVADNLIVPPETGDSAFLFIPAESAFAEIQAHHHEVLEIAVKRRVWLVSPTTVIAVINTARAAINDYQAQGQMKKMRETVAEILKEAQSFENRIIEISDHVNSAWNSVQRAEAAGGRLLGSVRDANADFKGN